MSHSITPFGSHGLSKITPEPLDGSAGQMLNDNFTAIDSALSSDATAIAANTSAIAANTTAIAAKASKVAGATNGHFASLTAAGDLADSGHQAGDFAQPNTDVTFTSVTTTGDIEIGSGGGLSLDRSADTAVGVFDGTTCAIEFNNPQGTGNCQLFIVSNDDDTFYLWMRNAGGAMSSFTVEGNLIADFLQGDGSSINNLNASNIWSGTIDDTHINSNSRYRMGHVSGRYYMWHGVTGVSGSNTLTANRLYLAPFFVNRTTTFTRIGCETTGAGGASDVARMGIYSNNNGAPSALVLDAGTVSTTTQGSKEIIISKSLATGWYWLGLTTNSTAIFRGSGASNSPSFSDLTGWIAQNQQTSILFQDGMVATSPLPAGLTASLAQSITMPTIWLRC